MTSLSTVPAASSGPDPARCCGLKATTRMSAEARRLARLAARPIPVLPANVPADRPEGVKQDKELPGSAAFFASRFLDHGRGHVACAEKKRSICPWPGRAAQGAVLAERLGLRVFQRSAAFDGMAQDGGGAATGPVFQGDLAAEIAQSVAGDGQPHGAPTPTVCLELMNGSKI